MSRGLGDVYKRQALTEEKEFRDIYGMDVIEIPTNKPVLRKDLEDAVYKTKEEKYRAVVEAVKEAHATGQPVLVGTITIEVSELLSRMLKKEGIQHNVLNAKYHEKEADDLSLYMPFCHPCFCSNEGAREDGRI